MTDRRAQIIEIGLTVLREHGFAALTQPRVATLSGMRQSLLTYYFPTRLDLLAAIGRTAVDRQLAAVRGIFAALESLDAAAAAIAALVSRHDNTRVLMALAQAGDGEPRLRDLFRELADGMATEGGAFLARMGGRPPPRHTAALLHATAVGLSIVTLATGEDGGEGRIRAILATLLHMLMADTAATGGDAA